MKRIVFVLISLTAVALSFILGRYWLPASLPIQPESPPVEPSYIFKDDEHPEKRVLVLLVDGPDAYCGNDRLPLHAREEFVAKTMELNRVHSFMVCASESARYGDVVVLIGDLRKRGLKLATVDTHPLPTGIRLPIVTDDW